MKTCSQCKTEKPLDAFYMLKNGKPDGRCKECRREKARADHWAHREKNLARMKARHAENRDAELKAMRERNPRYYQENRERLLANWKARRPTELERFRKARENLSDTYVRGLLTQHTDNLKNQDLPQLLVDAHRDLLKLKRELRNYENEKR